MKMSEFRRCLMHNKNEQCVRIGVGFSRFVHPKLDWMCLKGLESIEAWKHPKPIAAWERWKREFDINA